MALRRTIIASSLAFVCSGHSWVEQLTVIRNGVFVGDNGYPRGYVPRTVTFTDTDMENEVPPSTSERMRIDASDLACKSTQMSQNQTAGYPVLSVSPGDYIAMKYLENGHVTLPDVPPGKPPGSGTVFVFGTPDPSAEEVLVDVLQWSSDGTGGDGRGTLLATQNFDDLRCHQINNDSSISVQRQEEFPNRKPGQPNGQNNELWCETDVLIPSAITTNTWYTLYWVWQWSTLPGTPGFPEGKDQYYTTCTDIAIVELPAGLDAPSNPDLNQDPNTLAVSNYMSRTADDPTPGNGLTGASNTAAASTTQVAAASTTQAAAASTTQAATASTTQAAAASYAQTSASSSSESAASSVESAASLPTRRSRAVREKQDTRRGIRRLRYRSG